MKFFGSCHCHTKTIRFRQSQRVLEKMHDRTNKEKIQLLGLPRHDYQKNFVILHMAAEFSKNTKNFPNHDNKQHKSHKNFQIKILHTDFFQ